MPLTLIAPRRRARAVVLTLAGLAALTAAGAVAQGSGGPAVFVSPGGSDSNAGLTPDQPFQSLERAREALRSSPIKTVYLEGGVYARAAPLALTAADAGESWLALPGQTPVLDGGETVKQAIVISAPHVTIRWLTLQNYAESGIVALNAAGVVIDSNTVKNTLSTAWNQAGIVSVGSAAGGRITHNLVRNSQYDGILAATSERDSITGLLIQDNAVYDSCTRVADCGAIHVNDRGHASTGIRIDHNIIGRYGSDRLISKAIYMDDLLSNTQVTNNIVYGNGQFAIHVHGGDHNLIQNNILDVREATGAVFYQTRSPGGLAMTDNIFRCNIVYSVPAAPQDLWRRSGGAAASEDRNIYWAGDQGRDRRRPRFDGRGPRPRHDFVDPDSRNYALRTAAASNYCGFHPISAGGVGPLPNR